MKSLCGLAATEEHRRANRAWDGPLPAKWFAISVALLALLTSRPALAQQSPDKNPQSVTASSQAPATQLQTGTSVGVDLDARLQNLLANHQFFAIESELNRLPAPEAQFYRGILANRDNDPEASIKLLEPLAGQVTASGDIAHEKELRTALAQDYLRLGDWARAAQAYRTLESSLHGHLTPGEQDAIEMPLKLLPLAQSDPPMTVEPCAPFALQASTNPLGLTDIPVFVDARPHTWMLDPTSPFDLIALSLAKEAGLRISDDSATIRTLTGRPIQIRVAVIPRFTIGGRLTLRDMTAFVFNDADYSFPGAHYQVEGVLGYPALSAMGSLTITNEDMIEVQPSRQIDPPGQSTLPASGARFFLDGDRILVALGKAGATSGASAATSADPGEQIFAVDAAGQQTYLTARYYDGHTASFAGQKLQSYALPGQQPSPPQPAYIAETIPVTVGQTTIRLHFVPVFTKPLGSASLDDVYGVLGADTLSQLKSYTFDYRTMRFSVRPE